jgi:hypothetical protein
MQQMKFAEALKNDQVSNEISKSNESTSQKEFAIGNTPVSKPDIRSKQMEYAALLQKDQAIQSNNVNHLSHQPKESERYEGLKLQGVEYDTFNAKRQKQREYANLLQNDQHMHLPVSVEAKDQFNYHTAQHGGEKSLLQTDFLIGNVPSKADIRTKQMDYAVLLQKDQNLQSNHFEKPNQQPTSLRNGFGDPLLGGQMISKEEKRKKQMEYANLLQKDQLNLHHNINTYDNKLEAKSGSALYHHEKLKDQLKQSYQDQTVQDVNSWEDRNNIHSYSQNQVVFGEKDLKKQKQKEYASALLQQMEIKNQSNHQKSRQKQQDTNVSGYQKNDNVSQQFHPSVQSQQSSQHFSDYSHQLPLAPSHKEVINNYSSKDQDLGAGYIIGPLGIPVRKTLEVGNRKLQKAFNEHIQHQLSPPKLHFGENLSSPPPYDPSMPSCHSAESGSVLTEEKGFISGYGQDEEEKKKQLKLKQQMALAEQIRSNKERIEMEKAKNDELERKEQQKIEKELREMKEAFEKEQQKLKLKASEERNVQQELVNQRELKKREQERRLREAERTEEERILKERKELFGREEEDKRRERFAEKGGSPDFEQGNSSITFIFWLLAILVFGLSLVTIPVDHAISDSQRQQKLQSLFTDDHDQDLPEERHFPSSSSTLSVNPMDANGIKKPFYQRPPNDIPSMRSPQKEKFSPQERAFVRAMNYSVSSYSTVLGEIHTYFFAAYLFRTTPATVRFLK